MSEHLKDYLQYYQTCNSPGYAVLVTGVWGTGKTFQVKESLPENSRIYVSLFGLQSSAEIHAEVAAAMDPNLSKIKKLISIGGTFGSQALGVWKLTGSGAAIVSSLIKTKTDKTKTIIFDDLERCALSAKEALGVVNQYVEHFGCRVIVIAHDAKLADEFIAAKEKLFGQTISIEPQTKLAFNAFIKCQTSEARADFLRKYSNDILAVFEQSEVCSLRILRHIMDDLGRLFDVLTADHLIKESSISELVMLFSALDIEARCGLAKGDFQDRSMKEVAFNMGRHRENMVEPKLAVANKKYHVTDLNSELISDDLAIEIFIKGMFHQGKIRECLDRSVQFSAPKYLPAWRRVMAFDELEDDVVEGALHEMDDLFSRREYVFIEEILHVFALKLMMSENKIVDDDFGEILDECKKYIDDILNAGRLPPRPNNWRWAEEDVSNFSGHGYWVTENTKPYFNELFEYLNNSRNKSLLSLAHNMTDDILRTLETNGKELYIKLNVTHDGPGDYAYLPLLVEIPVRKFFESWMRSPKTNWRYIRSALKLRRDSIMSGIGLDAETEWFKELCQLMTEEAEKLNGFEAFRLKRAIP